MPEPSFRHPTVITVDVEDWPQSTWDRRLPISRRAADNTLLLLERFERLNVRATMFVLGNFTRRFPDVVRAIDAAGHEVACHGSDHAPVTAQTPRAFAEDVRAARQLLEDTIGRSVVGFRAPDFSIVRDNLWALEILAEEGFAYDSSIYPIRSERYGIEEWPQRACRLRLPGGGAIVEFPPASVRWRGRNWPVAGGGYHRLMPGLLARFLAARVVRERPFVFYCHPYEFDPGEFSALSFPLPLATRLHQGLGRGRFAARFEAFARRFGGSTRLVDLCDDAPAMTPAPLAGPRPRAGQRE